MLKPHFDYYDYLSLYNMTAENIRLESVVAGTQVIMNMQDNVMLPFCEVCDIDISTYVSPLHPSLYVGPKALPEARQMRHRSNKNQGIKVSGDPRRMLKLLHVSLS